MKNIKRLVVLFVAIFGLTTMVNAENYWHITEYKKGDDDIVFSNEAGDYSPSVNEYYENNEVVPGAGQIILNEAYAESDGSMDFNIVIKGEDFESEGTYYIDVTPVEGDPVRYTVVGGVFTNGQGISISPTKGKAKITISDSNENKINFARFNCDGAFIGQCTPETDFPVTEGNYIRFDTIYFVFNSYTPAPVTPDPDPDPGYNPPEEDEAELAKIKALVDQITAKGTIELDTVDPSLTHVDEYLTDSLTSAALQKKYGYTGYTFYAYPESEWVEHSYIEVCKEDLENNKYTSYEKEVNFIYKTQDPTIKENVSSILNTIKSNRAQVFNDYTKRYIVEDLDSVNYRYNAQKAKSATNAYQSLPSYSSKLHELTGNLGYDFMFDPRAGGDDSEFHEMMLGPVNILYNGIVYDNVDPIGFSLANIIYVPSDTTKSSAVFIEAAKTRIKNYLGTDVTITVGGNLNDLDEEDYKWDKCDEDGDNCSLQPIFDTNNTVNEWYNIKIGNKTFKYFIVADSSKMTNPTVKSVDMKTNVYITSNSADAPLDSRVSVTKLDKDSDEYKALLKKLSILDNMSYDINVSSMSLDIKIEKLSNGKFKVYIPLDEKYKDKKLYAAYVKDNGKVDYITMQYVDGYGVFETDHFSTYSVVETINPPTSDNVIMYFILTVISILAFVEIKRRYN